MTNRYLFSLKMIQYLVYDDKTKDHYVTEQCGGGSLESQTVIYYDHRTSYVMVKRNEGA